MIALRIRGLYAAALTQLFHPHDAWEVVQPSDEVRGHIDHAWRMDSPDVDIDDVPDDQGQRHALRISGPADAVGDVLSHLRQHCVDILMREEQSEVGALYMGVVGIFSRASRHAVIYLGDNRSGVLPVRYDDPDLKIGSYLPVRVENPAHDNASRLQLSTVLTIPGQYAVLTASPTVRLSKQITDTDQRNRLQKLGEAQTLDGWGIIWRTAAQDTADDVLVEELQRLMVEGRELREQLQSVKSVGRVRGGELTTHVYMPSHAKAVCDGLRAKLLPTLPGHHKYKAYGDVYSSTVDALERELPAEVLQSRTATLSLLSSVNAMEQPIQDTLRLFLRIPDGRILDQGEAHRVADNIQEEWVEVRRELRHKNSYPRGLRIDKGPGDYVVTRFHESSWTYVTKFYTKENTWQGDYAGITTPISIFSDQINLADLRVAVVRSQHQAPEIIGMDALEQLQAQGIVTADLVQKARDESQAILQQWESEAGPTPDEA